MNDNEIIEGLFARDETALTALRAQYGGRCLAIAKGVLPDSRDAEECVNDAVLAVWQNVPPERPRSLGAYAAKIVRNLAFDRLDYNQAKKRNAAVCALVGELVECLPGGAAAEAFAEAAETSRIIERFLAGEGEEARRAFLLRYWYCCPLPEVARRLGAPRAAQNLCSFACASG